MKTTNTIQNKNGQFYLGDQAIRLKGFGIGSWLNLEHYMVGLPTPDSMIRESFTKVYGEDHAKTFWNDYVYSFISEKDFELIKSSGANILRIPFNHRLFMDDTTDEWIEDGFTYLTYLLNLCDRYQIYALLDLHTAPGGQNPDWHSDNRTGVPQFWEFRSFQKRTTRLWGEIAKRYADREYLFGYDLLNEPAMCKWLALNQFYRETIDEIRKFDPNHLIILGGDHFSMDFSQLAFFDDPQLCLGFHFYPICWYPRLSEPDCSREEFNALFRNVLTDILADCKRYGLPCFCGEFGFERENTNNDMMYIRMQDTLDLFEEFDLSWVIWTYKDIGDMGLVSVKEDSSWRKLTDKIKQSWSQDKEKQEASAILKLCKQQRYPRMDEETEYRLSFRVRALLYELQAKHILQSELKQIPWAEIRAYPQDFKLENCNIEEQFLEIMIGITTK